MEKYNPNNPYIVTYTGRKVHLLNPTVDEISIYDIAKALSQICRYTGHTTAFYSVAQHCCYVSQLVPRAERLWGLLHDATEAYLGDVNSPLKSLLPNYQHLEENMMHVIAHKFGLSWPMPASVNYWDKCMLFNEVEVLLPTVDISSWGVEGRKAEGLDFRIWHMSEAHGHFLRTFYNFYSITDQTPL
jgi:uncharacterized protein